MTEALAPGGPELSVEYDGSSVRACEGQGGSEGLFEAIEACSAREMAAGHAVMGPHRDNLVVQLGGKPVGRFGSAGERRRAALALELAAMLLLEETGASAPIMLIDDVDAELDDGTVERALGFVRARFQTLVTTSKQDLGRKFRDWGELLLVEDGRVAQGA